MVGNRWFYELSLSVARVFEIVNVVQMNKEIVSSLSAPLCTTIRNFKTINQSKFTVKRIDSWPSYTEAFKIAHACSTCLCLAQKIYTLTLKMERRMESSVFLYVCLRKAAWRHKNGSERGGENAKPPAIPFPDIFIHFLSRFSVFLTWTRPIKRFQSVLFIFPLCNDKAGA